ncbi:hypothetical protein pipiens_010232 [Culex pipiens pipiens]|uniref:Uncharacterized protein n=1 Tax=Culex pipiens pipiens TaxID=38569 RepID=A0ABD1DB35_CULPP
MLVISPSITTARSKPAWISPNKSSVIAHIHHDHGEAYRLVSKIGGTDFHKVDQRCIYIMSTAMSMLFESRSGAYMPGVCLQTVTLLCWTIAERIKPTLLIKQMDHAMLKLQLDAEDLYEALYHIVNVIITTDKINGGPMRDYGKNRTAKDFSLSEKLNDHHGSRIHQNLNSASRNSQNVVGKLPEPVSVARECPTGKTDGVELVNMHVRCGSPCEASTSSRPLPAP